MTSLIRVFWAPRTVFAGLSSGATLVFPVLLLTFLIDLTLSLLLLPYFGAAIDAQLAEIEALGSPYGSVRTLSLGFAIVAGATANLLLYAAIGLLLTLVAVVLMGAPSFRNIFGVLVLGCIPALLGRVGRISAFLLGLTANPQISLTSLAGLVPFAQETVWYAVAQRVDFFDLWSFLLVVLGFAVVTRLDRGRGYVAAALTWGGVQAVFIQISLLRVTS